ncbi:MAG: N-6 DNA methylase, partial [Crenarchaeota archaeon]|nr:N-6 DNA methylase [Thermoproteota archaeon]
IRKRLVEKNYIDTVIGLPSSLFTNTGIPVTVLILKKSRALDEPVLFIDAAKDFIKVGKQNVLQERDIARIVDTYVERRSEEGYSSLVERNAIAKNDFNMNIPRYIASTDNEIAHDVDAHLLGGIPEENIKGLKVLNEIVPDILNGALKPLRPGYLQLVKEIDQLTEEILSSSHVNDIADEIKLEMAEYTNQYWDVLKHVSNVADIKQIMEDMLVDIKAILASFQHLNTYDGYQIIAEIWKDSLTRDLELIAGDEFYSVARTREPNMVTKGSGNNKREEQDGWVGALIPNELIVRHFYGTKLEEIEQLKQDASAAEAELDELVEAAKVEGSEENEVLFECLTKNKEDEPGNSFVGKSVKAELKEYEPQSDEYKMLENVDTLMASRLRLNREIKGKESELDQLVQDRILTLTHDEIDTIVYKKWFGHLDAEMAELIEKPVKKELDTLKLLDDRYKDTLDDLDEEFGALESELESLLAELVKT